MDYIEKTIKKNYIYEGKILKLRRDEAALPNGEPCFRESVEHSGGASVLYIEDGKVLLVRQFRYAYGESIYESPAGHGQQGIINIGVLNKNFEANETITLSILKQKGLISRNAGRMKVLADGILEKPLTIKSESYSIQAIKMIELTGGTVVILRD